LALDEVARAVCAPLLTSVREESLCVFTRIRWVWQYCAKPPSLSSRASGTRVRAPARDGVRARDLLFVFNVAPGFSPASDFHDFLFSPVLGGDARRVPAKA